MRDDLPETADLASATHVKDWLVCGWFTPDYRPLAEKFAANLAEHGAPYHLFAKPSLGAWNTRRKPSVVLEAMDAYPGKTVVLMDVDCIVRGDITPVTQGDGDVGITVIARNAKRKDNKRKDNVRHWLMVECSSRVVVFQPTESARMFATAWRAQIERSDVKHDEHSMAWAVLSCPSVAWTYIDQLYSGREVSQLPGGVICHDSAHNKRQRPAGGLKSVLQAVERRLLRRGRTKARKLQAEMSVLVKATTAEATTGRSAPW